MNTETKRLAIIASCLFFPTGLAGVWMYKNSVKTSIFLFRLSIYIFLFLLCIVGILAVVYGGAFISILQSFY
jgi:hypothetical protein